MSATIYDLRPLQRNDEARGFAPRSRRRLSPRIAEGLARMERSQRLSGFDPEAESRRILEAYRAKQLQKPAEAVEPVGLSDDDLRALMRASPFPGVRRTAEAPALRRVPAHATLRDDSDSPEDDPGLDAKPFKPRKKLMLESWLKLSLPPRDHLLGELLCTTSRWILIGDTGIGKTLLALEIAAVVAAGTELLGWAGSGRPRRVMFIDGEMPAETSKERLEIIALRYGGDLKLWFYNRDLVEDMPPLNTPEGETWLLKEIEAVKPDLIVFDSVMSLLVGEMSDEKSWSPVNILMRKLSSRRIAQIWLHHTGHDASRGFGTKTREWQVDTVAILTLANGGSEDDMVEIRFTKARLRTPRTRAQFDPRLISCGPDGWRIVGEAPRSKGRPISSEAIILKRAILDFYHQLADGVQPSPGFNGAPVLKIKTDALRDMLKSRGFLATEEGKPGRLTATAKKLFQRVKANLLAHTIFVEQDDLIWRPDHGPRQ
jgi:AAA domain